MTRARGVDWRDVEKREKSALLDRLSGISGRSRATVGGIPQRARPREALLYVACIAGTAGFGNIFTR